MNTASVGNIFGNVQTPHNFNIGLVRDLILLLFQSLLLFLKILYEILLVVGTMIDPYVAAGDSATAKHTVQLEHAVVMAEASPYDCTTAMAQILAAMQTVAVAVVV